MQSHNKARYSALLVLTVALVTGTAVSSDHAASGAILRDVERPVLSKPDERSGVLAWLKNLLGIRLNGPAIDSQNTSEVLATATCFDAVGASCNGFRNLQEYVAAVHASQNLGIPFERLKAKIQSGKTLAQAISELRPTRSGPGEAARAQREAQRSIQGLSS